MARARSILPRTVAVGVALLAVAALAGCTFGAPAAETPAASPSATSVPDASVEVPDGEDLAPGTAFTPLIASTVTTPAPVKGTDGKVHLAYELLLTNATALPFEVTSLEVADASTGEILLVIGPEDLHRSVIRLGESSAGTAEVGPVRIGGAETWIAWLDVQIDEDSAIPAHVEHLASGALIRPEGDPAEVDAAIGSVAVSDQEATAVAVPVGAGDWYMSEGCCVDDTHHRRGFAPVNGQALVPQRFAIDFFLLDEDHRTWEGDPSEITSYFSYRQPILAAASGTVVRSVDIFPNSTAMPDPPPIPPVVETVGNHVVVEIAPGLYALYGHMDPGSVRVKVGDTVEQGQELGLIGSSGNSTTPHLHFHLQTEPTFFPSDGVPYVFAEFELIGSITERIWDDDLGLQPTGELPFEAVTPDLRHDELPMDRTVIRVTGE
ncbi:M23 family metallopeptidase [Microbacterium awajiense]|uniref:M23 family metallopeptidase n=1 Tax=Microbacterium awajiense TaxID=415214 RepID=A0ABP7A9H0_9MICO